MIRVFGYLTWRSARNWLRRQLRHARSPRYLAAWLLGGAYLWMVLTQQRSTTPAGAASAQVIELVMAVFLAGAVAWAWIFGVERRVLAFSPAEVTFLFSAPVTRRALIQFKLLRTQVLILFNTLLWTLILSYERLGPAAMLRAIGIWLLLTTLSLHRLGASFVRTSLAEHGRFGARHRVLSLLIVTGVLVILTIGMIDTVPALRDAWARGPTDFFIALGIAAERPMPRLLLAPFRLMIRPLEAEHIRAWLAAAGPAAAIMLAHYVWVIRSDAAFEEAAAQVSLERARQLDAGRAAPSPRRGQVLSKPPFRLRPVGWPGGAIVWKNLIATVRGRRVRHAAIAFVAAGSVVGVLSFTPEDTLAGIVGWLATMWAGALIVIGPQWVRNDMRGDLLKLDLLRSYPVRGQTVILAEVMGSALVLSVLQCCLLLFAYVAFLGSSTLEYGLGVRTAALVAALVCLPAINFLGMSILNAAALLYPDWVRLGTQRSSGIEALGQNMLGLIAFVVLLAGLLAMPAGSGWLVFVGLSSSIGMWAVLPAVLIGLGIAAVEGSGMVSWLGRVFERTDASGIEIRL